MRIKPIHEPHQKVVLIIGAGFAGLEAAKSLAKHDNFKVILVDQRNHHLFQPLLYQVATAGLDPSDIAVPIRAQFPENPRVEVHMAKVSGVSLAQKTITIGELEIEYDFLIVACGANHSYFGNNHWEKYAPGLKSIEQAYEMRRRVLSAFELAEGELDPEIQKALLTFVIVGGGPTGVELAGAIADIARTVLIKDFRRINPKDAKIILVEAGPRIMVSFPEDLSQRAQKDLESLGVQVMLTSAVQDITASGVKIGQNFINARTVLWAAGVRASSLQWTPDVALDRVGRVKVNKHFQIPNYPDTFVIGDMAAFELSPGKFLPGLAPAAMQSGIFAAECVIRLSKNRPTALPEMQLKEFIYKDKGQMATIGKHLAIAQSGSIKLTGFIGWMAWLFVHVFYLVTFRNRLSVMIKWIWNYAFSKRGARLITSHDWAMHKDES